MNLALHELDSSPGLPSMSEATLERNSDQSLTITTADIDLTNEEKHLLADQEHPPTSELMFLSIISHSVLNV